MNIKSEKIKKTESWNNQSVEFTSGAKNKNLEPEK